VDPVLALRPEYRGQPVTQLPIQVAAGVFSTVVTSGLIDQVITLNSSLIGSFATRFAGFSEFRIIRAKARVACFSSTNPGLLSMWFSEDDNSTPTATQATHVTAKRFAAGDVMKIHELVYTPHDPAQQTWTLVASGAPIIGYFKLYSDNANFGSSYVATQYCQVEIVFDVQFRGLI